MAKQEIDQEIIELAKGLQGTPWCDEYEKMVSGMLYNPLYPKLLEGRHRARGLAYKFNNLDPNTGDYDQIATKRLELLGEILGKVGEGTFIEPPFLPDYGSNISIGENCFMNFG
ncbi:putative sugar O-acetyltransferase [Ilyonectria destructans]|nr:putative sugar O-acetyltransferase [Ilyonectria destructans]